MLDGFHVVAHCLSGGARVSQHRFLFSGPFLPYSPGPAVSQFPGFLSVLWRCSDSLSTCFGSNLSRRAVQRCRPCFHCPLSGRLACRGRGRCFPVSSWSGCWSLVWSGSPVFHGLPLDGLPCSSTPPVSSDLAYRSS